MARRYGVPPSYWFPGMHPLVKLAVDYACWAEGQKKVPTGKVWLDFPLPVYQVKPPRR